MSGYYNPINQLGQGAAGLQMQAQVTQAPQPKEAISQILAESEKLLLESFESACALNQKLEGKSLEQGNAALPSAISLTSQAQNIRAIAMRLRQELQLHHAILG